MLVELVVLLYSGTWFRRLLELIMLVAVYNFGGCFGRLGVRFIR